MMRLKEKYSLSRTESARQEEAAEARGAFRWKARVSLSHGALHLHMSAHLVNLAAFTAAWRAVAVSALVVPYTSHAPMICVRESHACFSASILENVVETLLDTIDRDTSTSKRCRVHERVLSSKILVIAIVIDRRSLGGDRLRVWIPFRSENLREIAKLYMNNFHREDSRTGERPAVKEKCPIYKIA